MGCCCGKKPVQRPILRDNVEERYRDSEEKWEDNFDEQPIVAIKNYQ